MTNFRIFELGDIFNIEKVKGINKTRLNSCAEGEYDYVTRTSQNNGIESITSCIRGAVPNEPNTFSLGLLQMTFFYRERPWYAGQFVRKIVPKYHISQLSMLYLLAHLRKLSKPLLSVLVRDVDKTFNQARVTLPFDSTTDKIDWQYMEDQVQALEQDRVKALEQDRAKTLEHYLQLVKLSDYSLSPKEQSTLDAKPEYKPFKLGQSYYQRGKTVFVNDHGIFDLKPTKKKLNANTISFGAGQPYVARVEKNNGIRGFIQNRPEYLNEKNTISFGQDTATMFYQDKPYYTGDKIQVFSLNKRYGVLTEKVALFLIATAKRTFALYGWGKGSYALGAIAPLEVYLPVNSDGLPDFQYMESYITAVQKLCIQSIVERKDKVIQATREVVG